MRALSLSRVNFDISSRNDITVSFSECALHQQDYQELQPYIHSY